jgi:hypothetical protein
MPTAIVSADQIIDKSLWAAKKIPYYNTPTDVAIPYGYINAGDFIGIVYSWLEPRAGRSKLWWSITSNRIPGSAYIYVPHDAANFSLEKLQEQGVKTAAQKTAEAAKEKAIEEHPVDYYADKYSGKILFAVAAMVIGTAIIKKKL